MSDDVYGGVDGFDVDDAIEGESLTSKAYFVGVSIGLVRQGLAIQEVADAYVARGVVACELADLPENTALRARLWPDLWRATA